MSVLPRRVGDSRWVFFAALLVGAVAVAQTPKRADSGGEIERNARKMIDEGRQTFRYEAFGDEAFWGDALQLHKAIAGSANGGVGGGVCRRVS